MEIYDEESKTVATAAWYPVEEKDGITTNREENAKRLVACWNALRPFTTEEIEKGVDLVALLEKNV